MRISFFTCCRRCLQEFVGDVLYVCEDSNGFLSSVGRGGDRIIYSLRAADIDFYLQTHNLLWAQAAETAPVGKSAVA